MLILAATLSSCGTKSSKSNPKVITIAATPVPQAEMLAFVKPELEKEGYELNIVDMSDYNLPNRALADGEVDANFFQHIPFLMQQKEQFHYPICILARVHIEPMGIYSSKETSLASIPDGAVVAVPSDPTNEARALLLLQHEKLITLDESAKEKITIRNIKENPYHLKIQEVDAPMLSRILPDTNFAVIPMNFALQAGLYPSKALALENSNAPYVNVIAVRCSDLEEPKLQALKKVMTSKAMQDFIIQHYHNSVIPAFSLQGP